MGRVARRVGVYLAALVFAFVAAVPFIIGAVTSFKQDQDINDINNNPFTYKIEPTAEHVRFLLDETDYLTFVRNTLFVGALVVAITLVLALPAAYSLARLDLKWSGVMGIAIFFVYLIPPSLLFISLSRVVAGLNLQDSKWSLVLIYPTITTPVAVWLLMGFFRAIPRDVEEQAMVDGYSRLAAFARVSVPLVLPGIIAVIVFAFTLSANEFLYALAFDARASETTVSVGVPTVLIRGDVFFWQSLHASAILVAIPIAFVFNLLLEKFIAGFTMGAVKG